MNTFETGDILLFSNHFSIKNPTTYPAGIIEYMTKSPHSHVGIILKSPTYLNKELTDTYLWESVPDLTKDAEDNNIKLGVKLTPISTILNQTTETIYLKKLLKNKEKFNETSIKAVHKMVYDKPYDFKLLDWLFAYLRCNIIKSNKQFFCSAFVAFILMQLNILNSKIDYDLVEPKDYDIKYSKYLNNYWTNKNIYSNELIEIKK